MSNFRTEADRALRSAGLASYSRQAEPVFSAIARKEEQVAANLVAAAVGKGMSASDARALVRRAGLHAPDPVVTPPTPTPEGTITVAAETLNSLIAFARQHGFRG